MTLHTPLESPAPTQREVSSFLREIMLAHGEASDAAESTGRGTDTVRRLRDIHALADSAKRCLELGDGPTAAFELSRARERYYNLPTILA